MIIGLHGYARSGKDSLAEVLIKEQGFRRIAFADNIRNSVYRLNPIVEWVDQKNPVSIQTLVDKIGWEDAKINYPEVRRLLQVFGTEVGRELFDENIWVSLALNGVDPSENIVITDMRFINEAIAVQNANGLLVKINRPGVGPINTHASDAGLPDEIFDFVLNNDGSLEDWHKQTRGMFSEFEKTFLFKDAPPRYGDFESSVAG